MVGDATQKPWNLKNFSRSCAAPNIERRKYGPAPETLTQVRVTLGVTTWSRGDVRSTMIGLN